jgi:FkbM family methyltransferase
MKKLLVNLAKIAGLYTIVRNAKRKIDKKRHEKLEQSYHPMRVSFYQSFLKPGDLVFDVGANVGNRVQAFLDLRCKVVAVEPQPPCVTILQQKFGNRIVVEPVGLGPQEGEMDMFVADESTISTFSAEFIEKTKDNKFKRNRWEKSLTVRISTLDNLVGKHGRPDFLKIDVEGFEPEVLKGLSAPVPKLSFEYNVPEMSGNVRDCIGMLSRLSDNYRFNYSIGESMTLAMDTWLPAGEFAAFADTPAFLQSDFGDIYAFIK